MTRDVLRAGGEMVARSCPLCGASSTRVFAEAHFDPARLDRFAFAARKVPEFMHHRLLECPGCDLLYASPVPALEALAQAYHDADFDAREESRCAAGTYAKLLPRVARPLPDRAAALDIGTGDGAFLEALLAFGFGDVAGVEPSSAPILAASDRVRPLIRHAPFRRDDFAEGRFSLVTCFQTLEHVADPLELARSALALLKPRGGVLFVVHNRRALSAKVLGTKSPIFDVEHLQLFSPRGARALLEWSGFVDVAVRPIVNRYPLQYWLRLAPLPPGLKRAVERACRRSGLGRLPVAVPAGNLVALGYKPDARRWPAGVARIDRGEAR